MFKIMVGGMDRISRFNKTHRLELVIDVTKDLFIQMRISKISDITDAPGIEHIYLPELREMVFNENRSLHIEVTGDESSFFNIFPQIPYNPGLFINTYVGDMAHFILNNIVANHDALDYVIKCNNSV